MNEFYCRFEMRGRLRLNPTKTRVWNIAGVLPDGACSPALDDDVWVGDPTHDPAALGVPLGTRELVAAHLQALLAKQTVLLSGLPVLADTPVAWLLLCFCAAPRAQYALRALPPVDTRDYVAGHDAAVLSCLCALLQADEAAGLPALATARWTWLGKRAAPCSCCILGVLG